MVTFQSTHPRGVRLHYTQIHKHGKGFNPRTHVGCDIANNRAADKRQVSIHAPTWGATSLTVVKEAPN